MKEVSANKKQKIFGIVGFVIVISIMVLVYIYKDFVGRFAGLGFIGLFVACFIANATVLLPAPSTLVVLEFAFIYNPVLVGLVGGLGAATGELTGYIAGRSGQAVIGFNYDRKIFRAFRKRPIMWVLLFSIIPWPIFDIAGIMAGIVRMELWKFYVPCAIGKTVKMLIFAFAAMAIRTHYPDILENFSIQTLFDIIWGLKAGGTVA